jgi:hypothetical protein
LNATTTAAVPQERRAEARTPHVRLEDGGLLLERLVVSDPDVVLGARRASARHGTGSLEPYVRTALSVGAKALAVAGGAADVDAVAGRIDELVRAVTAAADQSAARVQTAVERAADERTGTVAVAVRDALAVLARDVAGLVAGENAPLRAAVDRSLRDATEQAAGRVERALSANTEAVRAALSPSDPSAPMALLRQEVVRASDSTRRELGEQLAEVRTLLAVARERAGLMERTAVKGADYEQLVVDAVTEIAHGAGDTVDATGSDVGLVAHAKSGDAVVVLGRAGTAGLDVRVVVEAKDATLSGERWRRELEAGRRNRGAAGGLGVVRGTARMPGGRRRVHVIDPANIVVAWDPDHDAPDVLAAAYLLVRAGAAQNAAAGSGSDVDRAAVADAMRQAYDALTGFDALDRAAGAARRNLDDLAKAADALRSALHGHLARGVRLAGPAG